MSPTKAQASTSTRAPMGGACLDRHHRPGGAARAEGLEVQGVERSVVGHVGQVRPSCRLPAWEIILLGDARDGLFFDAGFFFGLRREDGSGSFSIAKGSTRPLMRHLPRNEFRCYLFPYRPPPPPSGAPQLRARTPRR